VGGVLSQKKDRPASSQFQHFLETARALGCDEDKDKFEAALGKIAEQKPRDESGPKKPVKRRKKPGQ
jgi:hypothetical protein